MNLTKAYLTTIFVFWAGINTAQAVQQPNYYECSGRNTHLTLAIGSKAEIGILPASTILNLQLGRKSYSFQEQDITVEPSLIGDLWEVTLNHVPDLHIDYASVVIPQINLGNAPIRFTSQLILTRVSTPFVPEAQAGVVNASKYIHLTCTASMLYY